MYIVPLDVIYIIVGFAEPRDVRSLSLLNHDCNAEVNRLLWRGARLHIRSDVYTEDARKTFEGFCNAIIRNPRRASSIRRLHITIKGYLWHESEDPRVLAHTLPKLGRALSYTRHLQVLQIFPRRHFGDIGLALSSTSPSVQLPSLHTFESEISFADGLERFMSESCPFVKTYRTCGFRALRCIRNFPSHLFPHLTAYSGTSMLLSNVLKDRPVYSVDCINSIPHSGIANLVQGLRSSSVPITELSITVSLGDDDGQQEEGASNGEVQLLGSLVEVAPNLRVFELFSHGQYDDDQFSEVALVRFAGALGRLKKLERFTWWDVRGPTWGEHFVQLCKEECPSLREMVLNGVPLEEMQFEL